ncbi:hypothetical protein TIFTF001_032261 [Ficus carica]|uniref:Uncharacterized protein n=1 Tax=Ficus carica TaxID=3494 RepID=A0AA88DX52_FICCA|nr:hypothetical protein TIFTF001_032261 [Ficus carica]
MFEVATPTTHLTGSNVYMLVTCISRHDLDNLLHQCTDTGCRGTTNWCKKDELIHPSTQHRRSRIRRTTRWKTKTNGGGDRSFTFIVEVRALWNSHTTSTRRMVSKTKATSKNMANLEDHWDAINQRMEDMMKLVELSNKKANSAIAAFAE